MTRRNAKHVQHPNHERWIVSYADFVTLLFAFFVVMFATANADKGKANVVATAVRAALDQEKSSSVAQAMADSEASDRKAEQSSSAMSKLAAEQAEKAARAMLELMPSMELLEKELKPEIQKGTVELHMEGRGLAISFKQAAFFDSGSDSVKSSALPIIAKVGAALRKIPNLVRLEGHTDNTPIHTARFVSNWDLSAARAIAVLVVFTDQFDIQRERMSIGGYADVAPVTSNDDEKGKARNRRVDVVILNEFGASAEPIRNR
jgi:chemotaxis protein MotB